MNEVEKVTEISGKDINTTEVISDSKFNKFFIGVFLINFIVLIFNGYSQGVYGVALPILMEETGIGAEVFGNIASYFLYGMIAGGILFGMLADKIGRKRVLIVGIAFFTLGTGLFAIASKPIEFAFYRIIAGMGLAGVAPVAVAIITEYSTIKERSTLITITTMGVPVGSMLAALLGIVIMPSLGWKAVYLSGFASVIMIVIVWLFLPESLDRLITRGDTTKVKEILSKANPSIKLNENDNYTTNSLKNPETSKASFSSLFKNGMAYNTILFWIIFATYMFTVYGITTWLPKLMINLGYPLGGGLWFLFSFTLGGIPSIIVSGKISNKFGFKKTIIAYSLMAAILIFVLTIKTTTAMLTVELFFIGAGIYGGMGLIYAYISSNYPNAFRGTGLGWGSAMGRFGGSFGPALGGILIARNASPTTSFFSFAMPLIIASIAIYFTKDYTTEKS